MLVSLRGERGWRSPYSDVLRYLEDLFGPRVDLVVDADVRTELRQYIEADAVSA